MAGVRRELMVSATLTVAATAYAFLNTSLVLVLTALGVLFLTCISLVEPVYAYEDYTHWGLTTQTLLRMRAGGKPYSSLKEIDAFLGPLANLDDWYRGRDAQAQMTVVRNTRDNIENTPRGLVWGSIAEDYLGGATIVQNHYFDPLTTGGLSDWEGSQDITGADTLRRWLASNPSSAPRRAQVHWNTAIKAYEAGEIRDAFAYLGRVVHLLEDMSLPSHSRNDNHLGYVPAGRSFGISFPAYNDHLYYDNLEKWCDAVETPILRPSLPSPLEPPHQFEVSSATGSAGQTGGRSPGSRGEPTHIPGEVKKYFPFISDNFRPMFNDASTPTSWEYIWGGKAPSGMKQPPNDADKTLWMNNSQVPEPVEIFLMEMGTDTAFNWFSDDTIPGNRTCPTTYSAEAYRGFGAKNETVDYVMSLVSKNLVTDAWAHVKDLEGNPVTEEVLEEAKEDYSKYPKMANTIFRNDIDKNRWELLRRRRFRINIGYLQLLVQDRFPKVTSRAAMLIQGFYDALRHVEIRGDGEERDADGKWRKQPIIVKKPLKSEGSEDWKFTVWVENCGGVKDDIKIQLGGIPDGWEVKVEPDPERPGCESITGELRKRVWIGEAKGVEPTPEKSDQGKVPFDSRTYEEPFSGERGAKLLVTIGPRGEGSPV